MPEILISNIMAVKNGEAYLRDAVESVLEQDFLAQELIVVDDASADSTSEILSKYPSIQREKTTGVGPAAARNIGLALATGKFVSFIDCDDIWPPNRSTRMHAALVNRPELSLVAGVVEQFVSPELRTDTSLQSPEFEARIGLCLGGILCHRECFNSVGYFREDLLVSDFLDWYMRFEEAALLHATIEDVVLRRRIHRQNFSLLNANAQQQEFPRVIYESLRRRKDNDQ